MAASTSLTPEQRKQRASIAALSRWSREDPTEQARKMRAGKIAHFEHQVDPNGELDPAERRRRAIAAEKLHMRQLAFRSSRSRKGGSDAA